MLRRTALAFVLALATSTAVVGVASAAANPSGTGQPSQSCQSIVNPMGPAGLLSTTNGFARIAVNVYAGAPNTPSLAKGNAKAISQYDVACYQFSQSH